MGKHIQLLLLTAFGEYFKPLMDAGIIYIAVSPLYRIIKTGQQPIYLKDTNELNKFFVSELENTFKFFNNDADKEITKQKDKESVISLFNKYTAKLEASSKKLNIDPHVFELAFLHGYDAEEEAFDLDKLEVDELENENINITGFHRSEHEENFVCLIDIDPSVLIQEANECHELLVKLSNITILNNKGNDIFNGSFYNTAKLISSELKKSCTVTRFKGNQ